MKAKALVRDIRQLLSTLCWIGVIFGGVIGSFLLSVRTRQQNEEEVERDA